MEIERRPDDEIELARRAHQMRRAGADMFDIARALKISRNKAHTLMRTAMDIGRSMVDSMEYREMLDLELSRLDALQMAVWDNAMAGDTRSVEATLKVMALRSKLLGLETDQNTGATTVVVTGETADYLGTLRAITGEDNA